MRALACPEHLLPSTQGTQAPGCHGRGCGGGGGGGGGGGRVGLVGSGRRVVGLHSQIVQVVGRYLGLIVAVERDGLTAAASSALNAHPTHALVALEVPQPDLVRGRVRVRGRGRVRVRVRVRVRDWELGLALGLGLGPRLGLG